MNALYGPAHIHYLQPQQFHVLAHLANTTATPATGGTPVTTTTVPVVAMKTRIPFPRVTAILAAFAEFGWVSVSLGRHYALTEKGYAAFTWYQRLTGARTPAPSSDRTATPTPRENTR